MEQCSEQSVPHVSKEQENFVKEFIQVYKDNQVLWDKKHPKYKNRDARNRASDALLNKAKEYYPDVQIDFVKHKIDGLRGTFRKEYRKVMDSKKAAKRESDVYIPTLWYFNLLLFTVGEEYDDNLQPEENFKNLHFWSREHTVILIDLFKKYPILYSFDGSKHTTKLKRIKAYNQVTKELICETGKNFEVGEVKKKILTLKQQFRRDCRIKENMGSNKASTLWCYELLSFLKDCQTKKEQNSEDREMSDDSTENMFSRDDETQMEADNKHETIFLDEKFDDIFDTIGKNVAIKLRDMTDDQRKYAENLINQVMYNGLMENLNSDSSIVLSTYNGN